SSDRRNSATGGRFERNLWCVLLLSLLACVTATPRGHGAAATGAHASTSPSPYLFVWVSDADRKQSDFLAVVDVRPSSRRYGRLVTTLPVGVVGTIAHHTEHEMPEGGILFANGLWSSLTFIAELTHPTRERLLGAR